MAVIHDRDEDVREPRLGRGPALAPLEGVAVALRRAREETGRDLRSVAEILRIRQAYLQAMESGAFADLPGTAYAIGFVRSYAEFLGLNGNQIVDRFKEEIRGADRRTELVFPEPVAESKIPGGALILISVVLLGMAYGGWFYLSNQGQTVSGLIPALPDRLQTLIASDDAGAPDQDSVASTGRDTALVPSGDGRAAEVRAPAQGAETPPSEADRTEPPPARGTVAEVPAQPAPSLVAPEGYAHASDPADGRPAAGGMNQPEPISDPVAPAPPAASVASQTPPAASIRAPARGSILDPPITDTAETIAGSVTSGMQAQARTRPSEPSVESTSPLLEQTVVIPRPPTTPQAFVMPSAQSPQIYGETSQSSRIVVRALQDSWVQVRDRQEALLLTRVLRSGDLYHVPNQAGLTLLTGNAGGIEIEVDGVRLPPLGPIGAVRRQIALDPTRLLNGTAIPR